MSKSKEISKMTNARSTKQELQDALKEAINVIKGFETFDPEAEIKEANKEKIYEEVEKDQTSDLKDLAHKLKVFAMSIEDANELYDKNQQNEFNRYKDLNLAIQLKNEELTNLYGIEKELFNLSAILNAQAEKKEELKEEYNKLEKELNEKYQNFKAEINNKIRIEELEYKNKKEKYQQIQDREAEEFEYEFERNKKIKLNDLEDIIKEKEKEINVKVEEMNKREYSIDEKEDYIKELEDKVSKIPEMIKDAETIAYQNGVDKTKKSNDYQKNILETSHKGKIDLLESKIESLTEKLDSANSEIVDLKNKLSESYNKIENMANKSMESSSNASYIKSLEKLASNKNENKEK